ncbi:MAG: glutamine-hydrolyzing carbamoyl-phosphate synthase small subunit [Candidatus Margulisiibacteriota bacterium]
MKAILALEDGTIFEGTAFGAEGESFGEVVFNTSMTGYQEIITDPSYKGQIVTMTYPLIGNYGINTEDVESSKIHLSGFVVRENSRIKSNWRAEMSLDAYLKKNRIIGIEGIDTRALTLHIRSAGAMKGVISTTELDSKRLVKKAKDSMGLVGVDLVKEVSCEKVYDWNKEGKYKVVLLDCGAKFNIMRELASRACQVTVVPAKTSAAEILAMKPNGVMLSNGPGDPAAVTYVIETVRNLIGKVPIFGICLGHQMLGLALGGKTYKLKFGHRGANQPVMDLRTRKVEITTQNHGFCLDLDSLDQKEVELTHVNLNDRTSEGLRHKKHPVFCVQYHPEASAGPHDSKYLFDEFVRSIHA